jgi:hypothetical protein
VTGIYCRVAGSGGVCEGEQLQEVVGGADDGPFGAHFLDAPQTSASGLENRPKDWQRESLGPYSPKRAVPFGVPAGWLAGRGSRLSP